MKYKVAYPNPSLRPADRLHLCNIDSQTNRRDILSQLCEKYPDHTKDLKHATFWKVGRLPAKNPMLAFNISITGY